MNQERLLHEMQDAIEQARKARHTADMQKERAKELFVQAKEVLKRTTRRLERSACTGNGNGNKPVAGPSKT